MTIPKEFARFRAAAERYGDAKSKPDEYRETFASLAYVVLNELRKPSTEVIDAMVKTPWPEGMSGQDQMHAMLNAAIDVIIGPPWKKG